MNVAHSGKLHDLARRSKLFANTARLRGKTQMQKQPNRNRQSKHTPNKAGKGGETHQTPPPGGPVADDESGNADLRQSELAARGQPRSHAARRLHLPRENHPLRSRAHSRAHRPRARIGRAWIFSAVSVDVEADARGVSAGSEGEDAGLRALFDGCRRRRLRRHAARRSRIRGEVLHVRGQLRPGRQQHPGLLHPGRDQVSRSHPLGEDGARSRLSRRPPRRTTPSGTSPR